MISLRILAVFFCFLIINHVVTSSDKSQDRVIRVFNIEDGKVEECIGSVYCFYPDKTNTVWRGSNWNICTIFVDPIMKEITKVETEVEEDGKKATYRLPDQNIHFRKVIASVENQKRLEFRSRQLQSFIGFGKN